MIWPVQDSFPGEGAVPFVRVAVNRWLDTFHLYPVILPATPAPTKGDGHNPACIETDLN